MVVGGGYIGLEMAESLFKRGIQTTIVEMADQVMAPLDPEMAAIVHAHLKEQGVALELGQMVKAFEKSGDLPSSQLREGNSSVTWSYPRSV